VDPKCYNQTTAGVKSLRYLGPINTTTPSISIYEGTNDTVYGGREIIITGPAANGFDLEPVFYPYIYVLITGRSSWTLFLNNDFSGNATCLIGTGEMQTFDMYNFKSITRGCDSKWITNVVTLPENENDPELLVH
jgi:hypothetical protein